VSALAHRELLQIHAGIAPRNSPSRCWGPISGTSGSVCDGATLTDVIVLPSWGQADNGRWPSHRLGSPRWGCGGLGWVTVWASTLGTSVDALGTLGGTSPLPHPPRTALGPLSGEVVIRSAPTQKALGPLSGEVVIRSAPTQKALGPLAVPEPDILLRFAQSDRAGSGTR